MQQICESMPAELLADAATESARTGKPAATEAAAT
jgi:hypothetical protein